MRTSGVYRDALNYVTDDGEWRHYVIFLHTSKRVATELNAVTVQKFEAGAVHIRERCRLASVLADAILTGVLKDLTAAHEARLPAVQSCWAPWLSKQMDLATARLRRAPVQAAVIPLVIAMLNSMVPGREADHLSSLLTWADHRGSDGEIVNGSTQIAPYPALAWAWRCVQSYKWTASQHINVLGLTTLLIFCALKRFQAACAVNACSTFSTAKWRPLSPPRDVRLPKPSTVSAAVFAPSCSPPTLSVSLSAQSPAGKSATLDPGSRNLTTMVRLRRLATVRRAHLKFVEIERKTQRRYNKAVEKFFLFCTFFPWFPAQLGRGA